ncbi:sporulation protein [Shewanella sp. CG12_big_fil_rev_8_21_14_0_65_47_15]|uniref:sporulation protein n=1 Tax=Shewanella sp. CG12_big_fil_rev_8_21_14_0_65_47_15 TaxID=1975537 RepID=UPI000CC4B4B2|nr:sporulation protein [Shewanella sp. CG12_big_fil_rev_8_21_14_0_65_47_15]PIW59061.1 MAG: sporulation control protein Spo0M [Shewanella sp. CG12_big_fil_rev_8_21_14_0_65_47_15]
MFKKILASVGIGGASVDTQLVDNRLQPGQIFHATIVIKGGNVSQQISGLDLALLTKIKVSDDNENYFKNHQLASWRLTESFEIKAGEIREIPFAGKLHPETPFTLLPVRNNQCQVWLQTGVDIDTALDPNDVDVLEILPTPVAEHVLNAMDSLGYVLFKADVEQGFLNTRAFSSTSGCYQELEFKPRSMGFNAVREVEVSLVCEAEQTHVLIELDRGVRGDGYQYFTLSNEASFGQVLEAFKANIR